MIIAAREGQLPFIMWMHDTYPDTMEVDRKTSEGWTAFHYACNNGFTNTMEYLMDDLKCDIHAKDKYNRTALHWAARFRNLGVVEFLTAAGLSFNTLDIEGWSALDLAKHHRNDGCIKIMLNQMEYIEKQNKRKAAKKELTEEKQKAAEKTIGGKLKKVLEFKLH